ncbi:hypothetical protein ACTHAM_001873 [Cellulomonas soli]|uniref:hypothetical protein n=1 Tax=Cellulomonas soli TaxID=931535 RepID=UPI003F86A91F
MWNLLLLGMGQAVEFLLARSLPWGDRAASLLRVFAAVQDVAVSECILAVAEGDFRFHLAELQAAVAERWPGSVFVPETGRVASVCVGYFEVPEGGPGVTLQLDVDVEGRSLAAESGDAEMTAQVIAWLTCLPGFPADGSVILAEWAVDFVPLAPATTAEDLLAILA